MELTANTGLIRAFDASVPPQNAPKGVQVALGYLGGNTPHVWTLDEWRRFSHLRQGGYWVADPTELSIGYTNGLRACAVMRNLGFHPDAGVLRAIGNDMETIINDEYARNFAQACHDEGFTSFIYGSLSTVVHMQPYGLGYQFADWDGVATLENVAHAIGHQYQAGVEWDGTEIDYAVFTGAMLRHFGFGPRL